MEFTKDQRGDGHELPGKYELILRTNSRVLNPEDTLEISILITGYGKLGLGPKLVFAPPAGLVGSGSVFMGYKKDNRELGWGGEGPELTDHGFIARLTAAATTEHGTATMFADYREFLRIANNPVPEEKTMVQELASERYIGYKSPIFAQMVVNPDCCPGMYKIHCYLTYHNGVEWNVSVAEIELKIRNWAERNATVVTVFGVIGILTSIYFGLQR